MKFLVQWTIHDDKRHDALKMFSTMTSQDDHKDMGEKVTLLGRWHDLASFTGVAICESEDAKALMSWALNWNGILDVEITPVVDDEEARELGRQKLL